MVGAADISTLIYQTQQESFLGGGWSHIIFGARSLLTSAKMSCKSWPTNVFMFMTGTVTPKKTREPGAENGAGATGSQREGIDRVQRRTL
jgi:hypothetical protein